MDWLGSLTIISGLTLTVFAITQSAHAPSGWRTPYIPVCFTLGILSLFFAGYIETRISSDPLLPASIFTTSSMTPLLLALFINWQLSIFSQIGNILFGILIADLNDFICRIVSRKSEF